jgi:hypothetical protein
MAREHPSSVHTAHPAILNTRRRCGPRRQISKATARNRDPAYPHERSRTTTPKRRELVEVDHEFRVRPRAIVINEEKEVGIVSADEDGLARDLTVRAELG